MKTLPDPNAANEEKDIPAWYVKTGSDAPSGGGTPCWTCSTDQVFYEKTALSSDEVPNCEAAPVDRRVFAHVTKMTEEQLAAFATQCNQLHKNKVVTCPEGVLPG